MSESTSFKHLRGSRFMRLTSYRTSGEAVATPVLYVIDGDRLYVSTTKDAGKVKRINNSPRVDIGPCDIRGRPSGPSRPASARILSGDAMLDAERLLNNRFGWKKRLIAWMRGASGNDKRVCLEIREDHKI